MAKPVDPAAAGSGGAVSWANVAVSEPSAPAAGPSVDTVSGLSTAVIDANAIMSGLPLDKLAERLVTIPEVLEEIRDKQSRARLASMPVELQSLQPSEESVAAVTRFARATGDLHSLSAVDIKVVALAHTLEVAAYGASHLKELPAQPRVRSRRHNQRAKPLPGWGQAGGTWEELDKLDEEEEAAARAASGAAAAAEGAEPSAGGDAEHDAVSRIAAGVQAIDLSQEQGLHCDGADSGSELEDASDAEAEAAATGQQEAAAPGGDRQSDASEAADMQQGGSGNDDEGGWETAAKSRNSSRRHKRKAYKRAAWEEQQAQLASQQASDSEDEWVSDDGASEAATDTMDAAAEEPAESNSSVVSVTADFAMQNVILQMGLRLGTPDGRRITHVSRWVLRCSACFFVTKDVMKLFCSKCGNAALEKVEVTTSADGQEQYGVRKKHNLRGTRFSLPKPKGGRQQGVPILREDVMLQRMPHMRPPKTEAVEPFAPEYGPDSWFDKGGSSRAAVRHAKGVEAVLAFWKHNPNERKHVRTNRRRK